MNVFVAEKDDHSGKLLGFILEPGNLHKLTQGKPITVHVEDYFPDGIPRKLELLIHFSQTPIADSRALAELAKESGAPGFDERTPQLERRRPSCGQCKSTLEQLGVSRDELSPIAVVFCPTCGATQGVIAASVVQELQGEQQPKLTLKEREQNG